MDLDIQLVLTSWDGDLETVKYLVSKGADVHAFDDMVSKAAYYGHLDIIKYLVENHDANVHTYGELALCRAVDHGHLDIVKYLVEKCDANVHLYGDLVLRIATCNGHLEVVKYLKSYIVLQFTKKHIDKQNLRYVFQQYELPFDIQQLISSYVLKKPKTKVGLTNH